MKKTIILLLGIVLTLNVNAQWYFNSFGVTNINELNEAQLNFALEKSTKTVETGQTLTFVGSGAAILGYIIYAASLNKIITDDYGNVSENVNKSFAGAAIMYGGIITVGIGIPLWISGTNRRNDIEIALKKYDSAYLNGIGVGLKFAF